MIVSDDHRFAFVHIPKCAGTAVRSQLGRFDSYGGYFSGVKGHPELGRIDYGHIPMDVLERHWPEAFDKVSRYSALALMRDPYERFGSSVRQTLHFYAGRYTAELSRREMVDATLRLIEDVETSEGELRARTAFFLPQVRFLYARTRKVVGRVFDVRNIAAFYGELRRITGHGFDAGVRANRDLSFRMKGLVRPAYAVNRWLWKAAPRPAHDLLKRLFVPVLTHKDSATARVGLLDHPEIRAFVKRFYADDIAEFRLLNDAALSKA